MRRRKSDKASKVVLNLRKPSRRRPRRREIEYAQRGKTRTKPEAAETDGT
jgi:hypothetical protein